jgi:hypothetical protein
MKRRQSAGTTAIMAIRAGELLGTPAAVSRQWRDDPELRLRAALLLGAVHDVEQGPERCARRFIQARHWIVSDDEAWPFSFLRICEALGADAVRLRQRLEPRFDVLLPSRDTVRTRSLAGFSWAWMYQRAAGAGMSPSFARSADLR